MSTNEAVLRIAWREVLSWPNLLATSMVLTGFALVALSLLGTTVSTGRYGWTDEKAVAYQAASADLHRLSMKAAGTAPEDHTRALQERLVDAQTKYAGLRGELDAARARPAIIASIMRYGGILFAAAGAAALYWLPKPSRSRSEAELPEFFVKRHDEQE